MHVITSGEEKIAVYYSIQEVAHLDAKNVQDQVYMIALLVLCMHHFKDLCVNVILHIWVSTVTLCHIMGHVTRCVLAVLDQTLIIVWNVSKMQKKTSMVSVYVCHSILVNSVKILPIGAIINVSIVVVLKLMNVECVLRMQKLTRRDIANVLFHGQETTVRNLKEGVSILVQHVRAPKHVLVPNAYRMLYTMPMVAVFVKKNGLELDVQCTLDHVTLFVLAVMDLALKTVYFVLLEPR